MFGLVFEFGKSMPQWSGKFFAQFILSKFMELEEIGAHYVTVWHAEHCSRRKNSKNDFYAVN